MYRTGILSCHHGQGEGGQDWGEEEGRYTEEREGWREGIVRRRKDGGKV